MAATATQVGSLVCQADIETFKDFMAVQIDGTWQTSTCDEQCLGRYLNLNVDDVFRSSTQTRYAVSVRCIKNAE